MSISSKVSFTDENIHKLFGHEAAEDEDSERLQEYYLKNEIYSRITANLPLRILVGHKGIGKSALFKIAIAEDKQKGILPIFIRPDDLIDIGKDASTFLETIRDWKKGLKYIIAMKVLEYAEIEPNHEFYDSIKAYAGKIVNFVTETFIQLKEKLNLSQTQQAIISSYLKNKKINIYIDDLDRGWESKKSDIQNLSALLNAVRDMSNDNPGLSFKISLRSDVYYLVRTSDESTDKIEGSVVWYTWTQHEILLLLIKRIQTYIGNEFNIDSFRQLHQAQLAKYLDSVFEQKFWGIGKWSEIPMFRVLMSMIRKRPRDLVKLCTLAAKRAHNLKLDKINTESLRSIFEEYSQGRIQDTVNEFKSELPKIESLLLGMKPSKKTLKTSENYIFTTQLLLSKINNIMMHANYTFANGSSATARDLLQFLYKINFLTARKLTESGEIDRKDFEENRYLSTQFVDYGYDWEIHPAYRWALQPDSIEDIFYKLDIR